MRSQVPGVVLIMCLAGFMPNRQYQILHSGLRCAKGNIMRLTKLTRFNAWEA